VVEVRVSGNRAIVEAELRSPASKHPQAATFDLFLIHGEWKIADFSV
jgi:hypothetical protein